MITLDDARLLEDDALGTVHRHRGRSGRERHGQRLAGIQVKQEGGEPLLVVGPVVFGEVVVAVEGGRPLGQVRELQAVVGHGTRRRCGDLAGIHGHQSLVVAGLLQADEPQDVGGVGGAAHAQAHGAGHGGRPGPARHKHRRRATAARRGRGAAGGGLLGDGGEGVIHGRLGFRRRSRIAHNGADAAIKIVVGHVGSSHRATNSEGVCSARAAGRRPRSCFAFARWHRRVVGEKGLRFGGGVLVGFRGDGSREGPSVLRRGWRPA